MPVTLENLHDVVSYHAPDADGRAHIEKIRVAAEKFMRTILTSTPACADQAAALRLAREAMMTANAAVALGGKV